MSIYSTCLIYPSKILKNYLEGDDASNDYAVLLKWDNIYYEKETKHPVTTKKIVRLGLVQWQMRPYNNLDDLMNQAEYFVDTVSGYRSDFALFPEFFMAPLMADYNHMSEPEAIRELAKHSENITQRFQNWLFPTTSTSLPEACPKLKTTACIMQVTFVSATARLNGLRSCM